MLPRLKVLAEIVASYLRRFLMGKLRKQLASIPYSDFGVRMKSIILLREQPALLQGIPQLGCLLRAGRSADVNLRTRPLERIRLRARQTLRPPACSQQEPAEVPEKTSMAQAGHESLIGPPGRSWPHVSLYKM